MILERPCALPRRTTPEGHKPPSSVRQHIKRVVSYLLTPLRARGATPLGGRARVRERSHDRGKVQPEGAVR